MACVLYKWVSEDGTELSEQEWPAAEKHINLREGEKCIADHIYTLRYSENGENRECCVKIIERFSSQKSMKSWRSKRETEVRNEINI